MDSKLINILNQYGFDGEIKEIKPITVGHINDTFKVVCNDENNNDREYILQSVNNNVFKEPQKVMENNFVSLFCSKQKTKVLIQFICKFYNQMRLQLICTKNLGLKKLTIIGTG